MTSSELLKLSPDDRDTVLRSLSPEELAVHLADLSDLEKSGRPSVAAIQLGAALRKSVADRWSELANDPRGQAQFKAHLKAAAVAAAKRLP